MIAAELPVEAIARRLGADAVVYQTLEDLQELYRGQACCFACFSGEYPIPGSEAFMDELERDRLAVRSEPAP
jgi:amidophosphoribosyltransferase